MAGPGLAARQVPQSASSILVHKSSSKPPLKTYSKRALKDTSEPPSKRQRIELPTISVQSTTKSGVLPSTPTLPKKRSISEYFKPVTHTRAPSSSQSSIFSSDPVQKHIESPPSSPPSPYISPSAAPPKKRARRRLTARPPLTLIKMSGINAGGSKEHGKGKGNAVGPFDPESSSRAPFLTEASPQGLRQVARDGASPGEDEDDEPAEEVKAGRIIDDIARSDPIDIPGARARSLRGLIIPFAPHRPYTFRGPVLPSPSPMAANRHLTSGSPDTLVEGSTLGSEMAFGSADTMVAGATCPQRTLSFQSAEDLARREMLLAYQPSDPDMMFHLSLDRNGQILNPVPGAVLQLLENGTRNPANLTDARPSTQLHLAGPSVAQPPTNSAVTGMVLPNIPAATNVAQGSANLVQAQLDLGRPTVLTCDICRFTWNRTIAADVRAHDEYHDAHTLGEPVIGLMTTPRYHLASINTRIGQGDYVVMVDRSSTEGWKSLALTVLERHVDKELGSAPISTDALWSSITDPAAKGSIANQIGRFKVYMYVRRYVPKLGRVVSLLLAERIKTGFETNRIQIMADEFGPWPAIVPQTRTVVSNQAHEAVLGINKFWTLRSSRRHGFGKLLVDQARQSFIRSYIIPRVHIAWTHTTDDGANFAKAYLQDQADYEFLTYDDQM